MRLAPLLALALASPAAFGSALGPPGCFVEAEVKAAATDEQGTPRLHVEVLRVVEATYQCPAPGEVFAVGAPKGGLAEGTKLRAGLAYGSSMGPAGAVSWLHWEPVQTLDERPLPDASGEVVMSLSSSTAPVAAAAREAVTIEAAGLVLALPAGWDPRKPTGAMRLAEVAVPGDAGEALLTVFHFGPGGGGGVEANLARWEAQYEAASPPRRSQGPGKVGTVHFLLVEGTQRPSGMGRGPSQPVPGQALAGAILEGEGGPWFLKLAGPAATVRAAHSAFGKMLGEATTR